MLLIALAVISWLLPNAETPGIINPAVTQSNIQQTICVANWTSKVRPASSYTTKLKQTQLATTYKNEVAVFGVAPAGYEEDHLISLELGGNPTDPKNLWPQPYAGTNSHAKDQLENKLHALVCSGKMPLATAQHLIATDWATAYHTYVGK